MVARAKRASPARKPARRKAKVNRAQPDAMLWILVGMFVIFMLLLIGYSAFRSDISLPRFGDRSLTIEDKCTVFFNNLLHTYESDDQCKQRCASQCSTYGEELKSHTFTANPAGCHYCACTCS